MKDPSPQGPPKRGIIYILDYIYKEISSWKNDLITERHLKQNQATKEPSPRILGYWDFHQRLAKTGDFIVFLEILSILREEHGLKEQRNIDICFIDDSSHYNAGQERFQKSYR